MFKTETKEVLKKFKKAFKEGKAEQMTEAYESLGGIYEEWLKNPKNCKKLVSCLEKNKVDLTGSVSQIDICKEENGTLKAVIVITDDKGMLLFWQTFPEDDFEEIKDRAMHSPFKLPNDVVMVYDTVYSYSAGLWLVKLERVKNGSGETLSLKCWTRKL